MIYEKKKLLIRRLIWFALFVLGVIFLVSCIASNNEAYNDTLAMISVFTFFAEIIIFIVFILSLLLSCKVYDYNGVEIIVYAGIYHHYIKVNGSIVDEYNTISSWTAITLSCALDDDTELKATISLSNRIALKINNKLYKKTK